MCHNCNGVGYLYKIFTCKIEASVSNQQLTAECRLFNANEIEKEFDKHYNELIRYAKNVRIEKTKTRWGKVCDNYKHAIDAENVENLELVRFSGHAVDPSVEDYKFNNVKYSEV